MTEAPINPLLILADEQLERSLLALHLACGRAKSVLKDKHRKQLCTLIQVLEAEARHRDRPVPQPPYRA